jgi:hypothetical protein
MAGQVAFAITFTVFIIPTSLLATHIQTYLTDITFLIFCTGLAAS